MTAISAATSHICITSLLCWVELRIKIPFSRKRTQSQYYVQKILDLDESIHFGQPWHHRKCYCTCAWVFPGELTFRRSDRTISPQDELTGIFFWIQLCEKWENWAHDVNTKRGRTTREIQHRMEEVLPVITNKNFENLRWLPMAAIFPKHVLTLLTLISQEPQWLA